MKSKSSDILETKTRDAQSNREAVIGGRVLDLLGRPESAYAVRVKHLWDDRYRVNVLIGEASSFAEIAHSYFLTADGDGNILEATPTIQKKY